MSFPNKIALHSFQFVCLTTLGRTSTTISNRSGDKGHSYFFSNHGEKELSITLLNLMLSLGCLYSYLIEEVLFNIQLAEKFFMTAC